MRRLLALATALVAAGALAATALAGNHYTDPTGDSGVAPDITSVDVSNDSTGTITFTVGLVSHPAIAPDEFFDIFINSDRNTATGDHVGADYSVELTQAGSGLWSLSGSQWTQVTTHGPITSAYTPTSWTVTINKADFGGVGTFDFWAQTDKGLGSASVFDEAPDGSDVYTYTLVAPATVSTVLAHFKPATAFARIHPGTRLVVDAARVKLSDGTTAGVSSFSCKASVGGKPLAGSCAWLVPKSARGKTISVTLTVVYQGTRYSTQFALKVLKT